MKLFEIVIGHNNEKKFIGVIVNRKKAFSFYGNSLINVLVISYFGKEGLITTLPDTRTMYGLFNKKTFPWYENIHSSKITRVNDFTEEIELGKILHIKKSCRFTTENLRIKEYRKELFGFSEHQQVLLTLIMVIKKINSINAKSRYLEKRQLKIILEDIFSNDEYKDLINIFINEMLIEEQ